MEIKKAVQNGIEVALVYSAEPILTDVQSALDLLATVKYETGCTRFAVQKEAVAEEFFRLSTCLAGEILQKFINYGVKFAVYGDFSHYTSKPLKDFIYESNCGKDVFFASSEEDAVQRLTKANG